LICPLCLESNQAESLTCYRCGALLSSPQPSLLPPPPGTLPSSQNPFSAAPEVVREPIDRRTALMSMSVGLISGFFLNLLQGPSNPVAKFFSELVAPLIPEPARRATAPEPPMQGEFEFFHYDRRGNPTGFFSPCEPIVFRINPENEPLGTRELVIWVLAQLSSATGMELQLGSDTDIRYSERAAQSAQFRKDVMIFFLPAEEFAQEAESPESLIGGGPIGFAGPSLTSLSVTDATFIATGGDAVFNIEKLHQLSGATNTAPSYSSYLSLVFLHEFGHVLGLDHVNASDHLMHPTLDPSKIKGLAPGDLFALSVAGRGACGIDQDGNYFFG
jgi:ssRNA-specific RNase YbeY (16S rRNA maturation enzyme)